MRRISATRRRAYSVNPIDPAAQLMLITGGVLVVAAIVACLKQS
jgi:hypothetical protein